MPYGLQCWNSNGDLTLNADGRYARLVYSTVTSSNGSVSLSEIQGRGTVEWAEAINRYFWNQEPPTVSRSGTTISWNVPFGADAQILVFLYT